MSRKDDNAKQAAEWLELLSNNKVYSNAIHKAIESTTVKRNQLLTKDDLSYIRKKAHACDGERNVVIANKTTYDAAIECSNDSSSVCILNFASYYKPGGGFLKGSYAQEESLCHVSGLYPVLKAQEVYSIRAKDKDVPEEYRSEIIYSPCVPFTRALGSITIPELFDVVSCAAPNCNRIPFSKQGKIDVAINERLAACYLFPYIHGCDTLVLGAWGCGVFKNSPKVVASTFEMLNKCYGRLYNKVVYAIPNKDIRAIFENTMTGI